MSEECKDIVGDFCFEDRDTDDGHCKSCYRPVPDPYLSRDVYEAEAKEEEKGK